MQFDLRQIDPTLLAKAIELSGGKSAQEVVVDALESALRRARFEEGIARDHATARARVALSSAEDNFNPEPSADGSETE